MKNNRIRVLISCLLMWGCSKSKDAVVVTPPAVAVKVSTIYLNAAALDNTVYGSTVQPTLKVQFTQPVKPGTIATAVSLTDAGGAAAAITTSVVDTACFAIKISFQIFFKNNNNTSIGQRRWTCYGGG
jgi:hypothetical protein